jgi:hypothetical protein
MGALAGCGRGDRLAGEKLLIGNVIFGTVVESREFAFVSSERHTVPIHRGELKQHVTSATHAAVPTECGPLPANCEQDELGGIQ